MGCKRILTHLAHVVAETTPWRCYYEVLHVTRAVVALWQLMLTAITLWIVAFVSLVVVASLAGNPAGLPGIGDPLLSVGILAVVAVGLILLLAPSSSTGAFTAGFLWIEHHIATRIYTCLRRMREKQVTLSSPCRASPLVPQVTS